MSAPFYPGPYAGPEEDIDRLAQENTGIPWADGPDRTYEQMERDDAAFAASQAKRRAEAQPEADLSI
jgi:hypothetical protein